MLEEFMTSEAAGAVALSDSSLLCAQNIYRANTEIVDGIFMRSFGVYEGVGQSLDPAEVRNCLTPEEKLLLGEAIDFSSPLRVLTEKDFEFAQPVANAVAAEPSK
jgi:hypothetical protein